MRPAQWLAPTDDENPRSKTWSCGCAGRCLGGLQRWCDILVRAFWSLDCCQVTLLACSDLASSWPYFCGSHLNLYGRAVICEHWAVFLRTVAVGSVSAHRGWSLSPCLPWEGSRTDGTPCSLGLTASVFGKREQMVVIASLRGKMSTSWIYFPKFLLIVKKRLLEYGSRRTASSTILKIKQIHSHQTICFLAAFLIFFSRWFNSKNPQNSHVQHATRWIIFPSPALL